MPARDRRRRPLLLHLLVLLALACLAPPAVAAEERAPILESPFSLGDAEFRRSCQRARGYSRDQCNCAVRALDRGFAGKDRDIGLLYLQLTLIAEHDVEAIMGWLEEGGDGPCPRKAAGPVVQEIARLHLAPGYLHGALRLLEISPERFKAWERRDEILAVRASCLPAPPSVVAQARRIEACIEEALEIKHCSRCHDYRGVDLME
ncbi:MAG: hypothetical protein WD341_08280 [Tistlia sp.]|uniref:hypothetical protein n=1 Tax=Tistlia sp. TaxID=3057121 RepID=UPI0034A329B7